MKTRAPAIPVCLCYRQSGETSDTLAALREGEPARDSTAWPHHMPRPPPWRASRRFHAAGRWRREGESPPPRALLASWPCLFLLGLYEAQRLGRMDKRGVGGQHCPASVSPRQASKTSSTGWRDQMATLAHKYSSANTFLSWAVAFTTLSRVREPLKLKEASYVHAEGYPVGELKHGPNAAVSDSVPLVVLATVDPCAQSPLSPL